MTTGLRLSPLPQRPTGIYVHVPFCERLCPYCDFAVAVRRSIDHVAYRDALLRELDARRREVEAPVRSIYFGGGTPSLWDPACLADVLDALRDAFDVLPGAEIGIEANPTSCTPERLAVWTAAGVNRISLGVQSFDDAYLAELGRNHGGETARSAIEAILGVGVRLSADLIVGGPGHDASRLERDLTLFEDLGVVHVSAYQMTIEPRTVYHRRLEAGELGLPGDDATADLLDLVWERLRTRGVEQYEVSSFAVPTERAVHNQGYWMGAEYLGLGMGAHSFRVDRDVGIRRANARRLKDYLVGAPGVDEVVPPIDHLRERLFLGVRSVNGVSIAGMKAQFGGRDSLWSQVEATLSRFASMGLLEDEDGVYVPTRKGYMFCDSMAEALFEVG